jgi:AhpC/TSA family
MKKYQIMFGSLVISTLVGCMPAPSSNTGSGQAPAQANTGTTTAPKGTGLTDIGSSTLFVTQQSAKVSFADIAKNSPADVVVFEFFGVECVSCTTEAPYVSSVLAKFGTRVQTVVIFPNQLGEYSTDRYEEFTEKYAANSPYAVDGTLEVLKKIRKNATQYFGIFAIVAKDGRGTILNSNPGTEYQLVEGSVKAALGL